MLWAIMLSGFTLGAAGSLHCVGMCGPLSLALPVHQFNPVQKFFALLLYQLGRIATYSVFGLIAGIAGRKIYISGFQQVFTLALGILVLLFATFYFLGRRNLNWKGLNRFYSTVQRLLGRLLRSANHPPGFFLVGMANGLLPCGMVYTALASAFAFPGVGYSVSFMTMFGAGTLPAMMIMAYAGQWLKPTWRPAFRRMVPVFMAVAGLLLLLRGMNLGIHFLSPELQQSPQTAVGCHS